jgi:hypothetical protein
MIKRRRSRPGDMIGRIIMVVVVTFVVLVVTGGATAGLIYYLTRPGVLPAGPGSPIGPGGPTPSGAVYMNSTDGLEKQLAEILGERRAGGDSRIKEASALPEKWFVDTYGAASGKDLYAKYNALPQTPEQVLRLNVDQALRFNVDKAHARHIDRDALRPAEFQAIQLMLTKIPMYTADATSPPGAGWQVHVQDQPANGTTTVGLGDFVYMDGQFRFFEPTRIWK